MTPGALVALAISLAAVEVALLIIWRDARRQARVEQRRGGS